MRLFAPLALLAALFLTACGGADGAADLRANAPDPATLTGPVIVLAVPEGAEAAQALGVLDKRLIASEQGRAVADPENARHVRCLLDGSVTPRDAKDLAPRLASRGTLEFRILAPEREARAEASKREELEQLYRLPPDRRRVPRSDGSESLLVEIPEQTAENELRAAQESGAPPERIAELQQSLDEIVAADVFGGADIVRAEPRQLRPETVVYFEIHDDRKTAFEDFTRRNLKRQMVLIFDGRVDAAPVIQSPLPGNGVISGSGSGFTPSEAAIVAATLEGDLTLPFELEVVRIEAPKPLAEEPR